MFCKLLVWRASFIRRFWWARISFSFGRGATPHGQLNNLPHPATLVTKDHLANLSLIHYIVGVPLEIRRECPGMHTVDAIVDVTVDNAFFATPDTP